MKKVFSLLALMGFCFRTSAQVTQQSPPTYQKHAKKAALDSSISNQVTSTFSDNIASISLTDDELKETGSHHIASVLTASRDPFYSNASYNFFAARFKMRGYDNDLSKTYINGIPMEYLDNGSTPFNIWSGLNEVMRNREVNIGLKYTNYTFGLIGNNNHLDIRASKQRQQNQINYGHSNGNYQHRLAVVYNSGTNKKGWAMTIAASGRLANEGYIPGTYLKGYSYLINKKIPQYYLRI
jgi:hypothetical protein